MIDRLEASLFFLAAVALFVVTYLLLRRVPGDTTGYPAAGAGVCFFLGLAMIDEGIAVWRDATTISNLVFLTFRIHPIIWTAVFAGVMFLVGALARHFTGGGTKFALILVLGLVAYALGALAGIGWIPAPVTAMALVVLGKRR